MADSKFKVVFSGELMPGFTLDNVKSYLATLFKSDLSKIDSLFTGKPVVLKRELKEADAEKYVSILRNAGALAHKEIDPAASLSLGATEERDDSAVAAPATDSGNMTCPKCGHVQAKATECAACGIIIAKFIARQSQPDTTTTSIPVTRMTSPYSPPQSSVGEALPEQGELRVFSLQGRIGRLRYLAWSVALTLIMAGAFILAGAGYTLTPSLGILLITAAVIGAIVVGVQISVQRLHDIGWSGWLCLLALIPYLGSIFNLIILLIPGSKGANRFGPPPPENSRAVKALATLSILVPVVFGILAAIAIPQYQSYVESARQVEQQSEAASATEN